MILGWLAEPSLPQTEVSLLIRFVKELGTLWSSTTHTTVRILEVLLEDCMLAAQKFGSQSSPTLSDTTSFGDRIASTAQGADDSCTRPSTFSICVNSLLPRLRCIASIISAIPEDTLKQMPIDHTCLFERFVSTYTIINSLWLSYLWYFESHS